MVASCGRTSSGFFSERSARASRRTHMSAYMRPNSIEETWNGRLTAHEVSGDLALPCGVQDLLNPRLLPQLLVRDLVARRGEGKERVHVCELPSGERIHREEWDKCH